MGPATARSQVTSTSTPASRADPRREVRPAPVATDRGAPSRRAAASASAAATSMSMSAGRTRYPSRARAPLPASSQATRSRASRSAIAVRAASGRGARDAVITLRGRGRRTLLPHDADLLRQRGPAHRSRVHDDHGRHHRPPSPPARRGRLLPDGHRRARRARSPTRPSARGAPRASRPTSSRRASATSAASSTRPTTSSSAPPTPSTRPRCSAILQRAARHGRRLQGQLRGLVLPGRARPSTPSPTCSRGACARSTRRRSSGWRRRTGSSACSAYRERLLAHFDANPGWIQPQARYNEARRMIELGLEDAVAVPGPGGVGRPGALGSRADDLRLDRRAPQLPHRPRLRPPRRGPGRALLAARPPADGQGHPQVPRGDLAGAC